MIRMQRLYISIIYWVKLKIYWIHPMPDDQEPVLNKEAALELCDDDEDLFLEIL